MKKLFCIVLLLLSLLCSCRNKEVKENESTTEIMSTSKTDIDTNAYSESTEETFSSSMRFYEYVLDETTGQGKYGSFFGDPIKYRGKDTNLVVGLRIDKPKSFSKDISMMCIMLLDGQLIPFSINGEDKQLVNYIMLENGKEAKYHLDFTPYGISNVEYKEIMFAVIPSYLDYEIDIDENHILYDSHQIISESEEVSREEYKEGEGYFFDEVENMYGKHIWEISKYDGGIRDYIIQKDDGKIYYMADYMDGEFVAFLFCDGKLFNGFDGEYYLKWSEDSQSYLHKEIDVSSLDVGNHIFYVVTVDVTKDYEFFDFKKSMNKEVVIYE